MTVPDPLPEEGKPGLTARLDNLLAEAFAEYDAGVGVQFLGDWVLVAEVHTGAGPVARIVSHDDTPLWRQQGLLEFASADLKNDILIFRLRGGEEE